ncbi:Hopanoid-associated RND transporter, HpnN [invertebrate metagenome]|uniref:Hopanoid-associated RND transporter, HpnN n=1 Tax=invertebrate metagenome TaxID=1711999 RepID=A0A484H6I2_9ZZZZ
MTICNRVLQAWVKLMQKVALFVVLVTAAMTIAAGWYVTSHFKVNTNTSDMLSRDLPFRQLSQELDAVFPQFSDTLVIVIDGATPDLANQATLQLTNRLRQQPNLFGTVHDLAGDPFFHQHSLLYMDVTALEKLSDRLATAQPFLSTLYRDPTLKGLADVLALALDQENDTTGQATMALMLRQIAVVVEAQAQGRFASLSWEQVMQDDSSSRQRRVLVIQPPLDFTTLHPARGAMVSLQALAIELDLTPAHGIQVRLTGSVALAEEELESVEASIGLANVTSLVLVSLLLIVGLRSIKLFIYSLVVLIVGLTFTTAIALLLVEKFNLISVAFAVLFIGLSVDFSIHFCLRYGEHMKKCPKNAAVLTTTSIGGPLTLTAVGAAIGFFSFLPTPYQGFAELGLIAGVGMFIALLTNLTVLPALLRLLPVRATPCRKHAIRPLQFLTWLLAARSPRALKSTAALFLLASVAVLPATRFDLDPLNLKDHTTESVHALRDIMRDERWDSQSIIMLADSPLQAHTLTERLSHIPTVAKVTTLSDYVPQEQDEKLRLISDLATFLSPLFVRSERLSDPSPLAVQQALAALERTLAAPPTLEPETRRLQVALRRLDLNDQTVLQELETALLATLPQQLEILRQGLQAGPVAMADLPTALYAREITTDGRMRVAIHPQEDLSDREALRRFVKTVQAVVPQATGTPVSLYESSKVVLDSFIFATFTTICILLILLVFLLRRTRDIIMTFLPLLIASLLTNSFAVVTGIHYNFANIIALPLLFGLGMANGIQLVFRERLEHGLLALLDTSTPQAITLSALTTIASFGSLALSTHPGTASMGLLLSIAVTVTLMTTLLVLPALMLAWPRPHYTTSAPSMPPRSIPRP